MASTGSAADADAAAATSVPSSPADAAGTAMPAHSTTPFPAIDSSSSPASASPPPPSQRREDTTSGARGTDSSVEMNDLAPQQPSGALDTPSSHHQHPLVPPPIPESEDPSRAAEASRSRAKSDAIGPSLGDDVPTTSAAAALPPAAPDAGPSVLITIFLLNGNRHPFKLDQKYLRKRNVAKEADAVVDPFTLSIYTLKELIWRDWRDEWDPRPSNPGAIRLIYFGKLLDDKQTLKDARFNDTNPNVVHMTVKPQEFIDDEENAKGERSSTRGTNARWDDDGTREAGCCRCSVM